MMIVFVDPLAVPDEKDKTLVSDCLRDAGYICDFVPQRVERTISWSLGTGRAIDPEAALDVESECLVLLSAEDAVKMIKAYHERQDGILLDELTLPEWVQSIQAAMPGKNVTIFIVGLNKYYRNQKLSKQQAYREKVTGKASKAKKKTTHCDITICHTDAEEAFVEVQLLTGCVLQNVDTYGEMAVELKRYTKSVIEKPKKKNRLESGFSFTETTGPSLSVSKTGEGLAKVWKQQLMQFHNFGPEMAESVVSNYPSPMALIEACSKCSSSLDVERTLGDINVRRGTSIVATNRRIGKEQARRIYAFITSDDPCEVLK